MSTNVQHLDVVTSTPRSLGANARPFRDQHGLELSNGSPAVAESYARAMRGFNSYRGDPIAIIDTALAEALDFVMGHILRAWVHASMWERSVVAEVRSIVTHLRTLNGVSNDRERRHVQALSQWVEGEWGIARATLDRLCVDYPRDLLALQMAHLSDFFHGDRDQLRNRPTRALPDWSRDDPGYPFILGMQAFGHEECGSYALAEETGRRALELEPEDCWAHHAVAHVMEMQCRQAEGIAFMQSREANWAQADNTFQFHNWWHAALFHLDQGDSVRALEIYDRGVRAETTQAQMVLLDAAALLWRMHLQSIDVGARWNELARIYADDGEAGYYAFNDIHAILALIATGNLTEVNARVAALAVAAGGTGSNAEMSSTAGLPVALGLCAFAHERYAEAVEHLMSVRYRAHAFGGSHAQRDIIHRTLIEAALRNNDAALARALVNERVALKPHCPFSWKLEARARAL